MKAPAQKRVPATPRDGDATRARMIAATGKLLRTHGYHGVGLREILAEAKAPRGSLYFHFPGGKEELASAALAASAAKRLAALEAALDAAPSLAVGLAGVAEIMAMDLEASGFRRGCPVATVALETAGGPEVVRRACAAFLEGMEAALAARIARERPHAPDPKAAARRIVAFTEGALLVAKATHDTSVLRTSGPALDALAGGGAAAESPPALPEARGL